MSCQEQIHKSGYLAQLVATWDVTSQGMGPAPREVGEEIMLDCLWDKSEEDISWSNGDTVVGFSNTQVGWMVEDI